MSGSFYALNKIRYIRNLHWLWPLTGPETIYILLNIKNLIFKYNQRFCLVFFQQMLFAGRTSFSNGNQWAVCFERCVCLLLNIYYCWLIWQRYFLSDYWIIKIISLSESLSWPDPRSNDGSVFSSLISDDWNIQTRPRTPENFGFKGEQTQLFSHQRLDMKINNSHACTINLGVQRAADQLS